MRRRVMVATAVVVLLIGFGGAAAWLKRLRSTPRPSEFDCLSTAHAGWLTITVNRATVHADWEGSDGRIDGVPGLSSGIGEAKARSLALELTQPQTRAPSHANRSAHVNIFALCDGVPRWWSGDSVTKPSFLDCVHSPWPPTLVQCVRDVAAAPAPAPSTSDAYDVAVKVWKAAGVEPDPPDLEPYPPVGPLSPRAFLHGGDLED